MTRALDASDYLDPDAFPFTETELRAAIARGSRDLQEVNYAGLVATLRDRRAEDEQQGPSRTE